MLMTLDLHRSSAASGMGPANGYKQEDDHKAAALHRRVLAAEVAAERANEELLKACERAEAAQSDAQKYHEALKEIQVCLFWRLLPYASWHIHCLQRPNCCNSPLQELKRRHDMALELLGERNERVEAVEDDVREMKHIFHTQLSSLVDELNAHRTAD